MPAFYYELSPAGVALLLTGPFVFQYVSKTYGVIYYGFLAAIYLTYLHGYKDQKERRAAVKLLSDLHALNSVVHHRVLRDVMENVPPSLREKKMEYCEWTNKAFAAAFPFAADFIARKLQNKINGKLRNLKSMAEIKLTKFSAGDRPPTCTGIKVHDYNNDGKIILDCNVTWNGAPIIEVQVRLAGQGFNVEIYEMTIFAECRVVLSPLRAAATPVGAFGASCRSMPFIHLGMRIGGVDVIKESGHGQVASLVENVFKHIISSELLYPNIAWNQIDKSFDLSACKVDETPCGLLSVHAIGARNLIVADITTSDPYLILSVGVDKKKTRVINRNLNPVWNEHHVMVVHDLDSQNLEIVCLDHDLIGSDDPMGRYSFPIGSLEYYQKRTVDIALEGVMHGTVQLELQYIPLDSDHSASFSTALTAVSTGAALVSKGNSLSTLEGVEEVESVEDSDSDSAMSDVSVGSEAGLTPARRNRRHRTNKNNLSDKQLDLLARKYSSKFSMEAIIAREREREHSSSGSLANKVAAVAALAEPVSAGTQIDDDATLISGVTAPSMGEPRYKKQSVKSKVSHFFSGRPRKPSIEAPPPGSTSSTNGSLSLQIPSASAHESRPSPSISAVTHALLNFKHRAKVVESQTAVKDIAYGLIVIDHIGCKALPDSHRHKHLSAKVQFKFEQLEEHEKKTTEDVHGNSNPEFKESVMFVVSASQIHATMDVKVKDCHGKSGGKTLGEAVINVGDVIKAGRRRYDLRLSHNGEENGSVVYFDTLFMKPSVKPRVRRRSFELGSGKRLLGSETK